MTTLLHRGAGMVRALALVLAAAAMLAAGPAAAQSREGSNFISGVWRVTGGYSTGENVVNFTVTVSPDGTFVDRDNYRGRWVISGSSFTMFYPDESQLGYVGTISGDTISGRFDGRDVAGHFRMSREGSRGGGGAAAMSGVVGSWTVDFDSPGGLIPWQLFSDGTFREGNGNYTGTWRQNGSTVTFYVPSSGITHVGRIEGARIVGNYNGGGLSGTFVMTR